MLKELKLHLTNSKELSDSALSKIRDDFDKVLNYIEMDVAKPIDIIKEIHDTFIDLYPYSGRVYRGVFVDFVFDELETTNELCSFTSNKNIANNFALRGDIGKAYVISQDIETGLDFGVLINELHDKGILLTENVQTFLGEDEVWCNVLNNCEVELIAELD